MAKHYIGELDEVSANGERIIAEVEGQEIAVFNIDDQYYGVANYCVHAAGPLCEGELAGHTTIAEDGWNWDYDTNERYITCPWHTWMFDVTTGKNLADDQYSVPTFDVVVEDGQLFVDF